MFKKNHFAKSFSIQKKKSNQIKGQKMHFKMHLTSIFISRITNLQKIEMEKNFLTVS
jgi:hypothetical protein